MLTFLRGAIIKYIIDFHSPFAEYICHSYLYFILSRQIITSVTRFQFSIIAVIQWYIFLFLKM